MTNKKLFTQNIFTMDIFEKYYEISTFNLARSTYLRNFKFLLTNITNNERTLPTYHFQRTNERSTFYNYIRKKMLVKGTYCSMNFFRATNQHKKSVKNVLRLGIKR